MKDEDYPNCIMRWFDNGPVYLVSTMHMPTEITSANRKIPRVTVLNKGHVSVVWGDNYIVNIKIPQLISDYNAWMG